MNDISKTVQHPQGTEEPCGWPVLSLFSGAGGLDLGFRNAGFRPELAIDVNPAAVTTYQDNHPQATAVQLDIAQVAGTDIIDLWQEHIGSSSPVGIIGGPPCQAFSSSNVHQSDGDPRRQLLGKYAGIIQEFSSLLGLDFFVFENVPGLTSKHHESCFDQFEQMCDKAGFRIEKTVIDAGSFGIPQHRKRLIVVGINRKRFPGVHFRLPEGGKQPAPVRTVLKDLPEPSFCTRVRKKTWILSMPTMSRWSRGPRSSMTVV